MQSMRSRSKETVSDTSTPSAFNKSAIFTPKAETQREKKKTMTNAERIKRARERRE